MRKSLFLFFLLFASFSFSQEGVKNSTSNSVSKNTGKIMLIPFEPKMYMSNIDKQINSETKWNFETIRENFRKQLDTQLKLKLKNSGTVVSFYSDSVKMSKDLNFIYNSTTLSYDLQEKPSNPTVLSNQKNNNIKNGQLAVELNYDKKFMNIKITNKELLGYLNNKYKSEYFVFVNELDINTNPDTYDIKTDSYQRDVIVHYSILDKTGKLIAAGAATTTISSKINKPKEIVSLGFSPIATFIVTKFDLLANGSQSK